MKKKASWNGDFCSTNVWPPATFNQSQGSDTGSSAFFALIQTWFLSLSFSLTRSFVVSVFKGEIISNEEDVNVLWCLIFKKDFIKNSLSVAWNQFLCVTATSIGDSFFKVLKKFTTEWKLYHAMIYGCGLLEHEKKYCKQKFQNYFPSYL